MILISQSRILHLERELYVYLRMSTDMDILQIQV